MATASGTASNYLDLLAKIVTFLSTDSDLVAASQQWTVERNATPPAFSFTPYLGANADGTGDQEVILKAPGLASEDAFYVGIGAFKNVSQDRYNLWMKGYVAYNSAADFNSQPGASPSTFLHLWDDAIPYWIVASGRRVIVVAQVSTTFHTFYLGAFLPYATPTQYGYPMFIGGSSNNPALRWSDNSNAHKSCWDPCTYAAVMYYIDGTWQQVYNSDSGNGGDQGVLNVWPYMANSTVRNHSTTLREGVDGTSYAMFPLELTMSSPAPNILGVLDGLYFISGSDNAAGDTVEIGSDTYLVVQNIFRTNRYNYCALKLA